MNNHIFSLSLYLSLSFSLSLSLAPGVYFLIAAFGMRAKWTSGVRPVSGFWSMDINWFLGHIHYQAFFH